MFSWFPLAPAHTARPTGSGRWTRPALLVALGASGLLAAWQVLTPATPGAFEGELWACQQRVAAGYVSSGIRISRDDRLTITSACDRAVRERGFGPS